MHVGEQINAMQDYQLINFVTPVTNLEKELMYRLKEMVEQCETYEAQVEELEDKVDDMEGESERLEKLEERNKHLENFFETVVNAMSNINGYWPGAEPWDDSLLQAVIDSIGEHKDEPI